MKRWLGLLVLSASAVGCGSTEIAYVAPLEEVVPTRSPEVVTDRLTALPAEARRAVEASRLPILLPEDPSLLASAIVTSGAHFIAWSAEGDDVHVSLQGTDFRWRVGTEPAPLPGTDQVRGRIAVVSENEGIQTATWDEDGVAWALDVECAEVYDDARCTEQSYVRALAETLQGFGGAR